MMEYNSYSVDIESLATPENSGYGIVIPNYAIVKIPDSLTSDLEWLYVQMPIQDQIDNGLKMDANTMNFWFDICAQEFPLALCEMQKSFKINSPKILYSNGESYETSNIPFAIKKFMHGQQEPQFNTKVFGNGCNFDCSILQENHRILFGDGNLWHYSAPNNVRTLRLLLSKEDEEQMKETVEPYLNAFCDSVDEQGLMFDLCLHNPLFDAAKEALFVTYIMNLKKTA